MGTLFEPGQFAGQVKAVRQTGALVLAETRYAPSMHVAQHVHDHALCCFVLDGAFTERHRRSTLMKQGSLLFHPRHEAHSHDFHAGGGCCLTLQFGSAWMARMADLGVGEPHQPQILAPGSGTASWLAAALHRELYATDAAAGLAIEGYALALLSAVSRATTPEERRSQPGWLRRAVELLRITHEKMPALADIASEVQVHPAHLARTFQRFYGCTMAEYSRRLRIEAAQRELANGARSLSEIALSHGFADQAHFTRLFKRYTGVTPGNFRRRYIAH